MHGRFIQPDRLGPAEGLLAGVFVLLVIGLLIVGAILVTRMILNSRRPEGTAAPSGPLRILEERFARGEIDEEEFRRRREILRS